MTSSSTRVLCAAAPSCAAAHGIIARCAAAGRGRARWTARPSGRPPHRHDDRSLAGRPQDARRTPERMLRADQREKRRADAAQVRDRLKEATSCFAASLKKRTLTVVPLTGDASDRRYFRVLPRTRVARPRAARRPVRLRDAAVRARSRRCSQQMPVPVPAILDHAGDLGVARAAGSRRRHAAGASRRRARRRARGALSPGGRVDRDPAAARRGARRRDGTCRTAIAFDVEKLTWELEFFTKHFLEGYRGVDDPDASATRCAESGAAIVARAGVRAARPLPSRLPQPQPDVARRQPAT